MHLYVDRVDLRRCAVVDPDPVALGPDQVRLRIDAFALTANNVTYGAIGDLVGYWTCFPAPDGWGRVPAWGFAEVAESTHAEVTVGTRVYGFLPMSTEVVMTPGRVGPHGFNDVTSHRLSMAAAYNRYERVAAPAPGDADREPHRMALHPLFVTSFLIDDAIAEDPVAADADAVVLTSASSKTAYGTAFLAHRRGGAEVVGLTSAANAAFVEGLGVYDRVVTYDDIASMPAGSAVLVDLAGSLEVRSAVHRHHGDGLVRSIAVGGTHLDPGAFAPDAPVLPGATPAFFFAPERIAARHADWGRQGYTDRVGEAWDDFAGWADGWMSFEYRHGPTEVERTWQDLLDNRGDPATSVIASMHTLAR